MSVLFAFGKHKKKVRHFSLNLILAPVLFFVFKDVNEPVHMTRFLHPQIQWYQCRRTESALKGESSWVPVFQGVR